MSNVIITTIGLAKIALATVEQPLILEKFAVGDGNGAEIVLNENTTELVNEKYRDLINSKYANNNNIVVECVLNAKAPISEGFYLRELGIFDIDGDLIAHVKLPQSYRPAYIEGQIVTENIFNVTLKVSNTANITIAINEQIFATQDSVNRLLERVETLEQNKTDLVNSSVGIEKWFNTDNTYKDQNIVKIGVKTYALMDESNVLNIADYPLLFANLNAVDIGDGTFKMPNFNDGTLRHLSKGNTRELGRFEADDFKEHLHGIGDIRGTIGHVMSLFSDPYSDGSFTTTVDIREDMDCYGPNQIKSFTTSFSSHRAGVTTTALVGGSETRMKNTSGQWYVLAKINI